MYIIIATKQKKKKNKLHESQVKEKIVNDSTYPSFESETRKHNGIIFIDQIKKRIF